MSWIEVEDLKSEGRVLIPLNQIAFVMESKPRFVKRETGVSEERGVFVCLDNKYDPNPDNRATIDSADPFGYFVEESYEEVRGMIVDAVKTGHVSTDFTVRVAVPEY